MAEVQTYRPAPLQPRSVFRMDGWLVWGGSAVPGDDERYHLYFSRWPEDAGHHGWVTHSQIAHAVADDPLGPFVFVDTALRRSANAPDAWDRDVFHNPTVLRHGGRYYLYYTGNRGNGEYWTHRNNQRIGIAVADGPDGPWTRRDEPLIDVSESGFDSLITTNPSCAIGPDGRFLMVYKCSDRRGEAPKFGPVVHAVAWAERPDGPFRKHPEPIFTADDAWFPGEDPFVWYDGDRFRAVLKDMGRNYADEERALVLFESTDGVDWRPSEQLVLCTRRIATGPGKTVTYHRLERPQLLVESGRPTVLYAAAKPSPDADESFNVHLALG